MSLENCPRCGRVFTTVNGGVRLCPNCIKLEEENFKKVFRLFSEKPSATAQQISAETGVDLKEIFEFVRENRLQLVKIDNSFKCEKCGKTVQKGRICDNCRNKLTVELKKDVDKHIADRRGNAGKYSVFRSKTTGSIIRKKTGF